MKKYFDPTTLGLLDDGTNEIPAHAVELSDEQYADILNRLSQGMQLAAADDGAPVLNPPQQPNAAQILQMIRARRLEAYKMESDPLKIEAEYDALESSVEPDYTDWRAKVAEIKERYPLPDQQ